MDEEANSNGVGFSTRPSALIERQISSNGTTMGTPQELQGLLQLKEDKIRELENLLRSKDEEIVVLKSHLDMYQSVWPISNSKHHVGLNNNIGLRNRKQRAGISAEPQREISLAESKKTFPVYEKDER